MVSTENPSLASEPLVAPIMYLPKTRPAVDEQLPQIIYLPGVDEQLPQLCIYRKRRSELIAKNRAITRIQEGWMYLPNFFAPGVDEQLPQLYIYRKPARRR